MVKFTKLKASKVEKWQLLRYMLLLTAKILLNTLKDNVSMLSPRTDPRKREEGY